MAIFFKDTTALTAVNKDAGDATLNIQVPNWSSDAAWTTLIGQGFGRSATGVTVTPVTALQSAAVYACLKQISTDVANLPLRLECLRDGTWQQAVDHPLSRMLRRPNKRQTPFMLLQHIVISYLLTGDAFLVAIQDRNTQNEGYAQQLIPIIPGMMSVVEKPNGDLVYHASSKLLVDQRTSNPRQKGPTRTLSQDDVIHLRNFSMDGDVRGVAVPSVCSEVIGLSLAGQQLAAQTYANGATFQGVLTTPNKLSPQQTQQVAAAWKEIQSGVANAGNMPILSGGLELHNISMTPVDAQLLESRRFIIEEVCRLFRLPPHKCGLLDGAKYNNIQEQNETYITDTLKGITTPLEQLFDHVLLPTDDLQQYRFRFDFERLQRAATLSERLADNQVALLNGLKTRAQVCREENWPIPDDAEADTYRVMLNTGVVGDTDPKPTGSTAITD